MAFLHAGCVCSIPPTLFTMAKLVDLLTSSAGAKRVWAPSIHNDKLFPNKQEHQIQHWAAY
eukprot:13329317-Ditylum_brightwellii.AAC.1